MTDEAQQTDTTRAASPAWSARNPGRAAAAYTAVYILSAVGGSHLVAAMDSRLAAGIAVTAVAGVGLAASLLVILSLCRIRMSAAAELAWVLAMTVVFALLRPSVFVFVGRLLGDEAAGQRVAAMLSFLPTTELAGNVVLIIWATFLGRLVSRVIREGKLILPVAVVASVADIVTVFWGVVAHVSEKAPEVAETFSTAAPVEAPAGVPAPILSMVGIGDYLFLALFAAVVLRYSMQPARTLWASFVLMLFAPLGFLLMPAATGLPGLPIISAAVLWANRRHLTYTPEERRALTVAGVLVAALAIAAVTILRR